MSQHWTRSHRGKHSSDGVFRPRKAKAGFPTEEDAQPLLEYTRQRQPDIEFAAYLCDECGDWHIGRVSQK